ncbi:MAG TPA: class I SAM-dependent methyltransferase [Candidatus Nanoarchaeia archaeon]|nr:class I SAM-dependent methyltransferase [Candidatus Nanoarchaeia archaeon]
MGALQKKIFAYLIYGSEKSIDAVLKKDKKKLFSRLKGTILEIGAGTGANLAYYSKNSKVICLEPNPEMHSFLRKKAASLGLKINTIKGRAEAIPLRKSSVDIVVSTHVLCSVEDVKKSVNEIKRVLKKGGKFVFIEHVAAKKRTVLKTVQNLLVQVWSLLFDRCQINRNIGDVLKKSGFSKVTLQEKKFAFPIVSPHVVGFARK